MSDPAIVSLHVAQELGAVVDHELADGADEVSQRRAVAGVLRRLADLVLTGRLRGLNAEWASAAPGEPPSLDIWYRTRRQAGDVSLALAPRRAKVVP